MSDVLGRVGTDGDGVQTHQIVQKLCMLNNKKERNTITNSDGVILCLYFEPSNIMPIIRVSITM